MNDLRKSYTAAMILSVIGLVLFGLGKLFFLFVLRSGATLFIQALLSMPAFALMVPGFFLLWIGLGFFVAVTVAQKCQAEAEGKGE